MSMQYPQMPPPYPVMPGYEPRPQAAALLPRRAGVLLILALVVLIAIAVWSPPFALLIGVSRPGPASLWEHFKEGGFGMWLVTLLLWILAAAFSVLGGLSIRGRRIPMEILLGLALLPFL